jgi:hypothetical protein
MRRPTSPLALDLLILTVCSFVGVLIGVVLAVGL